MHSQAVPESTRHYPPLLSHFYNQRQDFIWIFLPIGAYVVSRCIFRHQYQQTTIYHFRKGLLKLQGDHEHGIRTSNKGIPQACRPQRKQSTEGLE